MVEVESICRICFLKMDPDTAKKLFDVGATVVFLDVPQNTEVGIDMNVWRTGDKFKGLKMIPPGLHMLHYSAVGKESMAAPRTSFFHFFGEGEILVRKWDPVTETLKEVSDDDKDRIKSNKEELDRFLGAFPYDTWKKWYALTSHVSEEIMKRVQPVSEMLCSASLLEADEEQPKFDAAGSSSEERMLPKMHLKSGTELRFTALPSALCLENASPEFRTAYSLDSSLRLEKMLEGSMAPSQLLGELQVAFVSFLVGHVYDAFEHWKKLVHLFCTCDVALRRYPDMFLQLLTCMHYQIQEVPEDFFTDIISKENFLVHTLHILFTNLEEEDVPTGLRQRGMLFRQHLMQKFKWDFSEEPDEYAPTIVDAE
ncbi:protein AAR2 homolog [Amphibalanus amphitrite]|uniref:protein AAR2 homolog n=1 Tax=Amphibalanus amphitrite TaxID=1232801 RepID=UPI001C91645E|nr:protein AAR2 homolog [Amphibalanus amphitrite]